MRSMPITGEHELAVHQLPRRVGKRALARQGERLLFVVFALGLFFTWAKGHHSKHLEKSRSHSACSTR